MRKPAVLLAVVLLLLALAQAGQAVELEAGWYVKFGYISLVGWDGPDEWMVSWLASSDLGKIGPLLVEDGGSTYLYGRVITVPSHSTTEPGIVFEDFGSDTSYYPYYQFLQLAWQTNYDANRLQLQVFRHKDGHEDELVWRQTESGVMHGHGNVWYSHPVQAGEDVVFRLVAIPEPSGLLACTAGFPALWWRLRRRGR